MKVFTMIIAGIIGIVSVLTTIALFSSIVQSQGDAALTQSLQAVAEEVAYTATFVLESYRDDIEANVTLNLPKKILGSYYRIRIYNSSVVAEAENGVKVEVSLPSQVNASGEIDSRESEHFISVNASGYIIYR